MSDASTIKYLTLGMLQEQGEEATELAMKTKEDILAFVKDYVTEEDKDKRTIKLLGLTLASLEFEELTEEL